MANTLTTSKQIERLSSTWAYFKEQTQLILKSRHSSLIGAQVKVCSSFFKEQLSSSFFIKKMAKTLSTLKGCIFQTNGASNPRLITIELKAQSNLAPIWWLYLDSLRSSTILKMMLITEKWQKTLLFSLLRASFFESHLLLMKKDLIPGQ